jgi:hypothetical protein
MAQLTGSVSRRLVVIACVLGAVVAPPSASAADARSSGARASHAQRVFWVVDSGTAVSYESSVMHGTTELADRQIVPETFKWTYQEIDTWYEMWKYVGQLPMTPQTGFTSNSPAAGERGSWIHVEIQDDPPANVGAGKPCTIDKLYSPTLSSPGPVGPDHPSIQGVAATGAKIVWSTQKSLGGCSGGPSGFVAAKGSTNLEISSAPWSMVQDVDLAGVTAQGSHWTYKREANGVMSGSTAGYQELTLDETLQIATAPPSTKCPSASDAALLGEVHARTEEQTSFLQHMNRVVQAYKQFVTSVREKGGSVAKMLAEVAARNAQYEQDLSSAHQADLNGLGQIAQGWYARANCPATKTAIRVVVDAVKEHLQSRDTLYADRPHAAALAIKDNCGCGGFGPIIPKT